MLREIIQKMRKPRITHAEGMLAVGYDTGEVVTFPDDASALFLVEAYVRVPGLLDEIDTLRKAIDEEALHTAHARVRVLEDEVAQLRKEKAEMEQRLVAEVERRTVATQRATVLAKTLRHIREKL